MHSRDFTRRFLVDIVRTQFPLCLSCIQKFLVNKFFLVFWEFKFESTKLELESCYFFRKKFYIQHYFQNK